MVRVLIGLRRTIARHQLAGTSSAALVVTAALVLVTAIATLLTGLLSYAREATATDVLALVSLLWIGGRIAQSALSGEPFLRPEIFSLLPLPRRRLGWSLMAIGLLDPVNALAAIALGAVLVHGIRLGPAAAVTAAFAVALTVAAGSVLSTVAAGMLGPGSRRGRDTGTVVVATAISLLAMCGSVLPALVSVLRRQSAPWLSSLLRLLPTGWGPDATAAAARGDVTGALVPLLGLVLVTVLAGGLLWPAVLGRRMEGTQPARRGPARRTRRLAGLGTSATGAVAAKELRLWLREPVRLSCLVIALIVGAGTGVLPRVTAGTGLLLPFAGAITVVIAAACACNLYGNDGSSVWLTVMTPGSERADVRGRQVGWLIAVGPYAVASTVILTAVSGRPQAWPWALGLLAAVLGGGAGLLAIGSLVSVQPLDAAGNPTPAWSLKVHVALVAVALTALPVALVLVAGGGWLAVPAGVLTGTALAAWLGRLAATRLAERQVEILHTLAAPA
jgi:ABC-2 type transport system permease protein